MRKEEGEKKVGCGVMGGVMAKHCIEIGKHQLFVCSRTPSKCRPLVDVGATHCASPVCLLENRLDVVVIMAGYPSEVNDIVYGPNGVIEGLTRFKELCAAPILIDMTTNYPEASRKMNQSLMEFGSFAIDAPVSGGDVGARERRLSIMIGGDQVTVESLRLPFFSCMGAEKLGGQINYMGDAGNGQHTKMANQILIATNMIGVCEALLYSYRIGLEPTQVIRAVSLGAAGSWSLSNLAPRILDRNFSPGFRVDHFVKDMEIALSEARRLNLSLPGLALSHQLYIALKAADKGLEGTQALMLVLEKLNAIER